jgi:hypothetical protein
MVVSRQWKYIYHQQGGVEELYSQLEDPAELSNEAMSLDPAIRQVKAELRQYLIRWCQENNDLGMLDNGDLKRQERSHERDKPKRENKFGRRWY